MKEGRGNLPTESYIIHNIPGFKIKTNHNLSQHFDIACSRGSLGLEVVTHVRPQNRVEREGVLTWSW
jgi:hypothetical protein